VKFGIIVTTGDPRTAADLAAEGEAAGWDGVFYWDWIAPSEAETYDPWVVMAAMAMRTDRVRLGAIVTPPARRRPWKLARETMTLDRLSGGRLVVPVGLGILDDAAFGNVGEPTDGRTRAELLDESLEILQGLWSGRPFGYEGQHYRFGPMTFRPTPVQTPRIPIWVTGAWPHERSMRRTLRWDGIVTQTGDVDEVRAIAAYVARELPGARLEQPTDLRDRPFEIVVQGEAVSKEPSPPEVVAAFAEAGTTWWVESDWQAPEVDTLRRRIGAGPPSASLPVRKTRPITPRSVESRKSVFRSG